MGWVEVLMDHLGPREFENPFSLGQDGSEGHVPFSLAPTGSPGIGVCGSKKTPKVRLGSVIKKDSKMGFILAREATLSWQLLSSSCSLCWGFWVYLKMSHKDVMDCAGKGETIDDS